MSSPLVYPYPSRIQGTLIKRYKRFLADIKLASGEVITAHCPNTGPMTGVCTPGSPVLVSYSENKKRKHPYTWEAIEVNDTIPTWVGINTNLPNRVIKWALENHLLPDLAHCYETVRPEVRYGSDNKSRIDFLLTGVEEKPIYLEVKNVTWAQGTTALFPDTVTTRGQKHLRELISLLPVAQPMMLYFINRSDCMSFAPGESADPQYAQLFDQAKAEGVAILPYRFETNSEGIKFLGKASISKEKQ
ncbi:DNA/RNA nuclease SfsA [Euhalothece natronophila Z-M001]|uniref:Sugar fermentation stimulation protein homolog n=1 Tax=Euhalothece natronophila Z-M001 TaxID=522448 RepID=A0A5B8NP00_9CHRO|nr:DNA/RNA nuclease SfsA [Euhalothece natronophila]QDZ40794.1 DNA/RNA nuclease SfsA [Euhalothece natronophila Z-M001]